MASTAIAGTALPVTKASLADGLVLAYGISSVSAGTVELVTGLSSVRGFWATALGDTDTEAVVFRVREDLPTATGTITVDGTKLDEGQSVANAVSEEFSWMAIGHI